MSVIHLKPKGGDRDIVKGACLSEEPDNTARERNVKESFTDTEICLSYVKGDKETPVNRNKSVERGSVILQLTIWLCLALRAHHNAEREFWPGVRVLSNPRLWQDCIINIQRLPPRSNPHRTFRSKRKVQHSRVHSIAWQLLWRMEQAAQTTHITNHIEAGACVSESDET